jgi:hypothetical protein
MAIITVTTCLHESSYNSAIFEVTVGHDYFIHIVNATDASTMRRLNSSTARHLTSKQWQSLYDTKFVPDAGDLYLVATNVSFGVSLDYESRSWNLTVLSGGSSSSTWTTLAWPPKDDEVTLTVQINGNSGDKFSDFSTIAPNQRVEMPISEYNSSNMPNIEWPTPIAVNISSAGSWKDVLKTNRDGWMNPPLRLDSGYSEPRSTASAIQIALPFMIVVVLCNALKLIAIYYTLKESFSEHVITQGDAIASFLEYPERSTLGLCTLDKWDLVDRDIIMSELKNGNLGHFSTQSQLKAPEGWKSTRRAYGDDIRSRWKSNIFM